MGNGDIYVANTAAAVNLDGNEVIIQKDVTRVREGHPLHKKYPTLFSKLTVQYDIEAATARPSEQRGAPQPAPAPVPTTAPAPEPEPEVKVKPVVKDADAKASGK